ncbi:MAG TPA: inorganic diphosphatase [Bacteroidia bacterium]|nr:inorganic diphosphatase [Bacteroidia bacterium]HNP97806.1 inorganic diphosphatase [Bacteroidia bacterium]
MNPWHDVSPGKEIPETVNAIIEIPKGSRAKYELDKESGLLKLDRVLYSAFYYPANYGFIPKSYGDDHDPLDILVLSQIDFVPLCLVKANVIGVMRMVDSGEGDDKIIAVASNDVSVNFIKSVKELPVHFIQELRQFFEEYKTLEKKTVVVDEFQDKDVAVEIVKNSFIHYRNSFPDKK